MNPINHKYTIQYLNYIFVKTKNSKLTFENNKEIKEAFNYLSSLFNLSHTQCALFSVVFTFTVDEDLQSIATHRMLNFIDLELEDYFNIKEDIETLVKRGFIRRRKEDKKDNIYDSSFTVNQTLIDMIFRNEEIVLEKLRNNGYNFPQFCGHMCRINNKKLVNHMSREQVKETIINHEDRNDNLAEISTLKSIGLEVMDRLVIYYLIENTINQKEEVTTYSLAIDVAGISNSVSFVSKLNEKNTKPQLNDLIELNRNIVQLTEKAKSLLLSEHIEKNSEEVVETSHYYIKYDTIPERKLYFNSDLQRELSILETLLQEDNFKEYQQTMRMSGNKVEGISILLYGPSGTGKSSIVDELSRKTQRNIFQVDLSVVRSKWYGESESNIKKIFTEYSDVCNKGNTPILLLNECDALLGKRNNAEGDRHDQTEAVMTNLLLEHFEKNKGIIIGITNLVENLDPAFMRRFTMKYLIDKPTKKAVKSILRNKLNFLDEREVSLIADRYSLTGGEIENVSQKCVISRIITKSNPTVSEVMDFCEDEKIKSNPWKMEYE